MSSGIFKSSHFKIFLLLGILSAYLVAVWLPGGKIIAGGDVGIPVWVPSKQLTEVASSWWESHATGITSPITFTAIPFYLGLSFLEIIGFGPGLLQKIVFFSILAGGSISIYLLALTFNFTRWVSVLAALFYIFNLSSLTVWQRGVHNAMLMLLLAPLTLLILAWGIKRKKYSSILFINLASVSLAYVFGALGYVFSLWIVITIYLFITLLSQWKNSDDRTFIIKYFLLLLVSWLAANAFWIIHLLQSGSFVLGQFSSTELKSRGSDVLVALKPYHEPAYIFRALSRFYNFVTKDWGDIYLNPFFILLSWVPTLLVFSTALVKSNYKSPYWRFLITSTIFILVLSKGINPPLGFLNKIPYDLFAFLAPLRNPYEKVGILLGIPFSLLFALGVSQLFTIFKERKIPLLSWGIGLLGLFSITVLIWPLWVGKLFESDGRKYAVEVPPYYLQLNNFLKDKVATKDSRVLHLPLAWGESIDYNWGYTGIEPSQYFFDGSSIGYQLAIPSVDFRIRDVLLSVHNQNAENLQKALSSLNVGWIVLHNETLFRDRILESPERINKWFSGNLYFLENKGSFGPLSLWRVKDEYRTGHFSSMGKLISLGSPQMQSSIKIWPELSDLNDGFLTEVQDRQRDKLEGFIDKKVIFPKGKMIYSPLGSLNPEQALNEVAVVNHLPDSFFYPLITLKEKVMEFLNQNDQVRTCFGLSGKKLKEAALLQRQGKSDKSNQSLQRYEKQLDKCTKIGRDTLSIYLNTDFLRNEILGQLIREKVVLGSEFKDPQVLDEAGKAGGLLNGYLADLGLSPRFEPLKLGNAKRMIFSFEVNEDGQYEIKIQASFKNNPPKIFQIDDQDIEYSAVKSDGESVIYPTVALDKGFHEVHLEFYENENLLSSSIEEKTVKPDLGFTVASASATSSPAFLGEASSAPVSLIFNLPGIDIESVYELVFDMDFYQGSFPEVFVAFDSDPIDKTGNLKPSVKRQLQITGFPTQLSNVKLTFNPPLNSTSAKVGFNLPVSNQLGGNTKALIKNIRVERVPEWDLILEETSGSGGNKLGSVEISSKKINPTLYEVNLKNQSPPYLLTFSETFHPLWEVTDLSGRKIDLDHLSVNGFSNGWLVEEQLPEKIKVKFPLQDSLFFGTIISVVSFIVFFILLKYMDKRSLISR